MEIVFRINFARTRWERDAAALEICASAFPPESLLVWERLERYRAIRAAAGVSDDAIDREIGEMYVLRRICVADTDAEALREVQEPLRWHREMTILVHGARRGD